MRMDALRLYNACELAAKQKERGRLAVLRVHGEQVEPRFKSPSPPLKNGQQGSED